MKVLRAIGRYALWGGAGLVVAVLVVKGVALVGGRCALCDSGTAGAAGALAGLIAAGMQERSS
jgi:hypothetical protein